MKISGDWISDPQAQKLLLTLAASGHRALFVGGCVRNAILGIAVQDVDIATAALPETVTNLAQSVGFRVIPTGLDHGTVTVLGEAVAYEVTTFRDDLKTDGRHAVVAFSKDIEHDARRRDFTMNALYADATGLVIDPLDGLSDLLARRVRFVGDPHARIREDYLRILRFFRFYAIYGDPAMGIEADGLAACAESADGVGGLSAERVSSEMRKLLGAQNPAPAIASMHCAGILSRVLPRADPQFLARLVHLEEGAAPRWQRRFAVICGEDTAERLCFSKSENGSIRRLRAEIGSGLSPRALGWRMGDKEAQDVVLCRAALFESDPPAEWRTKTAEGAQAVFPVTAADLMPALQGPALGIALRQIEKRWLASDLKLTKAQLLA